VFSTFFFKKKKGKKMPRGKGADERRTKDPTRYGHCFHSN
jgi:hypothetical protein